MIELNDSHTDNKKNYNYYYCLLCSLEMLSKVNNFEKIEAGEINKNHRNKKK